jgi:hypothetical protein
MSRCCLRDWLRTVPDPHKRAGRRHPLEFVPALAVCAFTAAGHDSPTAIAEWSRDCTRETLAMLDGRPDPLTGRIWPPSERTFRPILEKISAAAFNRALYSFLDAVQEGEPEDLPDVTGREREQRRAAAKAAGPGIPGPIEQAACDGKAVRGAVRPDGTRVHLMTAFRVSQKRTLAQHEVGSKSNEIPELIPVLQEFNISGMVITADALHGQRDAAEKIHAMGGYYLQFIKGNQPTLAESTAARLTGTGGEFADESWTGEGKGRGRRERRSIRTAPASGIDWPSAEQVMRIRRDSGTTHGPWEHREFALAITNLPADLAGRGTWPPTPGGTGARKTASIMSAIRRSGRIPRRPAPGIFPTFSPRSATSQSAHSPRKGTPTWPQHAAITDETAAESSNCTDTPEPGRRKQKPS